MSDFDLELLKCVLKDAYEYGIRSITYLGGEPTLHPKINEIIKFTKAIGMEEVVFCCDPYRFHRPGCFC